MLMLMTLGHLLIRVAVLLITVIGTFTFYIVSFLDKTASNGSLLGAMAILCGVLMSMVHNTWNVISAIALASMGPSQYLDEVDGKMGPIYREEFRAELARLRTVSDQNQKHQRGMFGIGTLAEGLIFADRQQPTEASEPKASVST